MHSYPLITNLPIDMIDILDAPFSIFVGMNKDKYFLNSNNTLIKQEILYYCIDSKTIIYDKKNINKISEGFPYFDNFYNGWKSQYVKIN